MKTISVTIPEELNKNIEATQLELNSVKNLLGFAYTTTEYDIPEARISKLESEYKSLDVKYTLLKQKVEELVVPDEMDRSKTSWNLDFLTGIVTVTEND